MSSAPDPNQKTEKPDAPGDCSSRPTKKARREQDDDDSGDDILDSDSLLPPVTIPKNEFGVVQIQFQKDCQFPKTNILKKEYCKFLRLKVSFPSANFAPSYLIDKMWHAHILSTEQYHAFCKRHNRNGAYLHHDPTMQQGQERYELTLEAYRKHFGEEPTSDHPDIWPKKVDTLPGSVATGAARRSIKMEEEEEDDIKPAASSVKTEEQEDQENDRKQGDEEKESEEDDCKAQALKAYLDEVGHDRGETHEELAEWHKNWIFETWKSRGARDPNKDWDSKRHGNCYNMCEWRKGDFSVECSGCVESSLGIGAFSCC